MAGTLHLNLAKLPSIWATYPRVLLTPRPSVTDVKDPPEITIVVRHVQIDGAAAGRYASMCGFDPAAGLPVTFPHVLATPLHLKIFSQQAFALRPMGLIHLSNVIENPGVLEPGRRMLLSCEVHQLIRSEESYVGPSEEPVTWEAVIDHARGMGLILSAHGKWTAPKIHWDHHQGRGTPYFAYHFGAQVAEVEVDLRTGQSEVIGFWAVHDPGTVIFPQGAYGQIYGGVAQGLGYALFEEAIYDQGYLQTINFSEYLIPTALDVPEIQAAFVEKPFSQGPYGAKNVGYP